MPVPTRAQIESAWGATNKLFHQTYLYGSKNATNYVALLQTLQPLIQGTFSADGALAAAAMRSVLSGSVSKATAQNLFRPWLRTYCEDVIGRTNLSSDQAMVSELYKYFIDNTLRVSSRVITFGSPTAVAGNIGTTQIVRLTRDRYNFDIESGALDLKRARCVVDSNSGTSKGNETWYVEGQVPPIDDLQRSGSGLFSNFSGLTADDSLLSNSDFRNFAATTLNANGVTTTPTDITDWTSSGTVSGTLYNLDNIAANNYRVSPSNTRANSYSLVMLASSTLSQRLSLRGTKLNPDVPYLLAVIWNRQLGTASGTLLIQMGSTSNSISVSAQTGWTVSFAPPSAGWSNWYRVFAQDDLNISVQWTQTSGNLYIAEVLLLPGTPFDGSWYWVLPSSAAAYTAPRALDEFRWADTAAETAAVNQRCLAFAFGAHLPSANGSGITWADS